MKRIIILFLVIAAVATSFYLWKHWQDNQPVPNDAVNMEYPLEDGNFVVVQSGRFGNIHTSEMEKYAMDITKSSGLKAWFQFRKTGLESDASYETPVYSPCNGSVKHVVKDFPDMPIGIVGESSEANSILIDCDGFNVSLVHFKKDSVVVAENDIVQVGQQIAQVGNSGKSTGPHLHIAAYKIDSQTNKTINIPITFAGQYFRRGDSFSN